MKKYVVTVAEPVLIRGRRQPDEVQRYYRVMAKSKRGAKAAVIRSGAKGTVVDVIPEEEFDAANNPKQAEDFFYAHTGLSYDPKKETPEQARRRSAKALAEAEEWAADEDYEFIWRSEEEAWSTFLDDTEVDDVSDIVWVAMDDGLGDIVQSLGGIIEGHDEKANAKYRRVVEAELALEEMTKRGAASAPTAASVDLQLINRHRAKLGMRPLDPISADWTPDDVAKEADFIRALNPAPRVSLLQGAVTAVLTGIGVTGIVLGRRKR